MIFFFFSSWEKIDHVNEAIIAEKLTQNFSFLQYKLPNLFKKMEDGKCFMELSSKNIIALCIPL